MDIYGLKYQLNGVGLAITKYDSSGPNCTSDNAQLSGPSVCDDVILIPVNSVTDMQFVRIVVKNKFVTLCEVQVFSGKRNKPLIFTVCFAFLFKHKLFVCIFRCK